MAERGRRIRQLCADKEARKDSATGERRSAGAHRRALQSVVAPRWNDEGPRGSYRLRRASATCVSLRTQATGPLRRRGRGSPNPRGLSKGYAASGDFSMNKILQERVKRSRYLL
jgi:hypothetical protein